VQVPAYEIDVADTTGAGDVYHAALIEGLYFRDWSLERAGHFASAAAALSCTALGARAAAPSFEAVERLLARQRQDLPEET
ncbi:MAG: PfkB family carbohydrate kinase, partial [Candidatus Limnocylindria bacterium]